MIARKKQQILLILVALVLITTGYKVFLSPLATNSGATKGTLHEETTGHNEKAVN